MLPAGGGRTVEHKLGHAGVLAGGGLGQLGVRGPVADDGLRHDRAAQALRHHVLPRVPALQRAHLPQSFELILKVINVCAAQALRHHMLPWVPALQPAHLPHTFD